MRRNSPFQNSSPKGGRQAAVDLIRDRIREIYGGGSENSRPDQPGLVDRFWQQHKDHPEPQSAWAQFYAGLSDTEKNTLWNEYHQADSKAPEVRPEVVPHTNDTEHSASFITSKRDKIKNLKNLNKKESLLETKQKLIENVRTIPTRGRGQTSHKTKKSHSHWRPLIISVSTMLIWLFAQYNPLVFAFAKQYVSPGDTLRSPVIVDPSAQIEINDDPRIIIPKINVDVPVVYDLGTRDETAIQDALEDGVVHYAGTSQPGQAGNNVIVGHSSNNFLNSGKYKFAFVLLDRLSLNDTFILHYEGTRYVYKITNKQVVEPTDFSLTEQTTKPSVTLITCTPPGTSWKRLIIQAEQISPTITAAQTDSSNLPSELIETPADAIVPGNSESLFQRIKNWVF